MPRPSAGAAALEPLEHRYLFCDWGWLEAVAAAPPSTGTSGLSASADRGAAVSLSDYQHGGALHVDVMSLPTMGPIGLSDLPPRPVPTPLPGPIPLPSPPPTPTPLPAGTTTLRIETGGTSSFTDSSGRVWSADSGFSGGTASTSTFAVANTTDDKLYITRRWGNFSYSRAVTNGQYTLRLYFSDPLYTTAGLRKFDVTAENNQILDNFDIAASGGGRAALVKTFTIAVTDGRFDLSFHSVVENAIVSAVELVPAVTAATSKAPAAPTSLKAAASLSSVTLTWEDRSSNESGFRIERRDGAGGYFRQIASVAANATKFVDSTNLKAGVAYTYRVRSYNASGASTASNESAAVSVFFSTITWKGAAPSPITRAEAARGAVGDKMYVFGGYYNANIQATPRCDVFDPAANTWTRIADMPIAMTHQGMVVDGSTIWLVGGYIGDHPGPGSTMVWKYDTAGNKWSRGPDLPSPRGAGAAAMVGRKIYFFGGMNQQRTIDMGTTWVLDLDDRSGAGWRQLADMPNPRNHLTGIAYNGKVYAIGGHYQQESYAVTQDEVDMYDPVTGQWTRVADTPLTPRSQTPAATFVWKDKIIVVGGADAAEHSTTRISAYDPILDRWQDIGNLPGARRATDAAVINGRIIVTTGNDPYPSATTWISSLLE